MIGLPVLFAAALVASGCKGKEEPAAPAPAGSGSGPGTAAPKTAVAPANPRPSTGLGVILRTTKTSTSVTCRSALCSDSYLSTDGNKLKVTVDAEPGVTLRVPGATLKNGDTWTYDLLDALARTKATISSADLADEPLAPLSYELGHGIKMQVVRDGKTVDENLSLALNDIANRQFEAVTKGTPFAFPQDASASFPKDAIALVEQGKTGATFVVAYMPNGVTIGDVDLVAMQRQVERQGSSCDYYDSARKKVTKQRFATDTTVELYDRRTGKSVDKTTFPGALTPCPSTIMSDEFIRTPYADSGRTARWLASHVTAHPGQLEAAPPALPPLGAATDRPGEPVASPDAPPARPSRLLAVASAIGVTDADGTNLDDVFDRAFGSLGDDLVTIEEFRTPPAPTGGSSAAMVTGGTFVAAIIEGDPDPKAAQATVQRAIAKAPQFKAMFTAANIPPWFVGDPLPIPDEPTSIQVLYDDKNEAHKGTLYFANFKKPTEAGAKRACRGDAKRTICVEAQPPVNVQAVLARIK